MLRHDHWLLIQAASLLSKPYLQILGSRRIPYIVRLVLLFTILTSTTVSLPVLSRSNSEPTSSTCIQNAAASPTAPCGSPPPLWMTAPWRGCSPASSPSGSCTSAPGTWKVWGRRSLKIRHFYPKRRAMRIQTDGRHDILQKCV